MNKNLKIVLKVLSWPFYFVFVLFPNWVDDMVFNLLNRKIDIKLKHSFYLVNPKSGKRFGDRMMSILKKKDPTAVIIDITKENYVERVRQRLKEDKELLYIVICGGDGTFSRISDDLKGKLDSLDRIVLIPFPIGTGNDLSRSLNLGSKMNINYIYRFFNKLKCPKSRIVKMDTWRFNIRSLDEEGDLKANFSVGLYLYFGIGYDAEVVYRFERLRKLYPYLLISNVS